MEVPVVQQEAVDEEEHPDLENNQNIEKSVLAEIEKKITEPKISGKHSIFRLDTHVP